MIQVRIELLQVPVILAALPVLSHTGLEFCFSLLLTCDIMVSLFCLLSPLLHILSEITNGMSRKKSKIAKIFFNYPELQGFRERVIALVNSNYGGKWKTFAKNTGIPADSLSKLNTGQGTLSLQYVLKLLSWDLEKAIWLLTGQRVEIRSVISKEPEFDELPEIIDLLSEIKRLKERVGDLEKERQ